jgi:hypothetical protein
MIETSRADYIINLVFAITGFAQQLPCQIAMEVSLNKRIFSVLTPFHRALTGGKRGFSGPLVHE